MLKNGFLGIVVVFFILGRVITYKLPYEVLKDILVSRDEVREQREHEEALKRLPENGEIFEEDMKMDDDIRAAILNPNQKRSGIKDKRWENGIIPFLIEEMEDGGRKLLKEAMEEFRRRTCIDFIERTTEVDYVVFTAREDYCASNVGRCGGKQEINLGKHCGVLGTHLHEIMHALGFIHEHSRHDRDSHIKVAWENIKISDKSNFNKYSLDYTASYGETYNFASVMHYRNDAFSTNGEDTIVSLSYPSLKFGQRIKFSVGDVQQINNRYNCKKKDYVGLYHNYGEREIKQKKDRLKDMRKKQKLDRYS